MIKKMKKLIRIPKFKIAQLALCLLIGWVCVSCQTQSKHPNILENPACKPPCWENITPDVTTKRDALNILQTLSMVDQPITERHDIMPAGVDGLVMFTLFGDKQLRGSIYFVDDKVSLIELGNSTGFTLQQTIEKFGAPQSVYVYIGGEYRGVTFLLPQSGVAFSYTTWAQSQDKRNFWGQPLDWVYLEIRPDVEINFITYFAPNQYKSLLDLGELTIGDSVSPDELSKRLFTWSGYGSMERYLPPSKP